MSFLYVDNLRSDPQTLAVKYHSLVRFPFTCTMKPFVDDSNESIDMHSPRELVGLIFFVGFLPFHGFRVPFLYIQLTNSGLPPMTVVLLIS